MNNNPQKILNDAQTSLVADLVQTYGISPSEINFYDGDPEPDLGYEASCVLANSLVPDLRDIDVSPADSPFSDALTVKCTLIFADGRSRSAVGVVNFNETIDDAVMSPQQLYQTGTSRAIRNVLRVAGIDLISRHHRQKTGAFQYTPPKKSNYQSLLAQAHALGREAGLITDDTKTPWHAFLHMRYGVSHSNELGEELLADFVAVLRTLTSGHKLAA